MSWLTQKINLNRWQIIVGAFLLGMTIASVVALGKRESEHAASQRQEILKSQAKLRANDARLAGAIKRLSRIEHPTRADRRRLVDGILKSITPAQARRLSRVIRDTPLRTFSPPAGSNSTAPERSRERPGTPRDESPSPPPSPRPPTPAPSPPAPGSHLTPPVHIDPDGSGPVPPIDLPPLPPLLGALLNVNNSEQLLFGLAGR